MDRNFFIRRATFQDIEGILACLQMAFAPFRGLYTEDAYNDTVPTLEGIRHRLSSMQIYVAVTDTNDVIGTIACNKIGGDEGHLRGMAVQAAWQGRGVSAELLKAAETALAESGCSRISLDTTALLERAIRFYEKNGFRRTGKVTDFFGMPLYEYAKKIAI